MIGGEAFPIRTDFRTAVRYEMAAMDGRLTEEMFWGLWFPEKRPKALEEALEAVGWFYAMGKPGDGSEGPIPYGFQADAGAIFAAFRKEYGIDLGTAELHWWEFRALLEGLIGHSFRERVGYRTADLRGRSAEERAEILKFRARYAIGQEDGLAAHLKRLEEIGGKTREGK